MLSTGQLNVASEQPRRCKELNGSIRSASYSHVIRFPQDQVQQERSRLTVDRGKGQWNSLRSRSISATTSLYPWFLEGSSTSLQQGSPLHIRNSTNWSIESLWRSVRVTGRLPELKRGGKKKKKEKKSVTRLSIRIRSGFMGIVKDHCHGNAIPFNPMEERREKKE